MRWVLSHASAHLYVFLCASAVGALAAAGSAAGVHVGRLSGFAVQSAFI